MSSVIATDSMSYAEALSFAESGGAGARPISRNGMRVGRTMAGAGWGQLAFWAHQEEAAQARAANEEAASRAGWVSAQGLSRDESGAVLVDRRLAFMSNDGNLVAQFDAGSGARLYTASDESGAMLLTIMESDGSTTTQAVPAGQWMQFDELVFRQWYEATYLVAASPVVAAVPAPAPTQAAAVEPAPVPTDALPRTQHAGITLAMVQSLPEPARIIITTAALDFIGERAVSRDWLQQREAALTALRTDYNSALCTARDQGGGSGWSGVIAAADESGAQSVYAAGNPYGWLANDGTFTLQAPYSRFQQVSGERGDHTWVPAMPTEGPVRVLDVRDGRFVVFDEWSFTDAYRRSSPAPLEQLAALYGTSVADILNRGLFELALAEHQINDGAAFNADTAMLDAGTLAQLDLYLNNPQVRALIDAYGGAAPTVITGHAPEQARLYGTRRYGELSRLDQAMQSVRDQFSHAMGRAHGAGAGIGWIPTLVPKTEPMRDEWGNVLSERVIAGEFVDGTGFDADVFTAWYITQAGLANRTFAEFYGRSRTTVQPMGTDEFGQAFGQAIRIVFDNSTWVMHGIGATMSHTELHRLNLNDGLELYQPRAIYFDPEAGWSTAQFNITVREVADIWDAIGPAIFVVAVGIITWGIGVQIGLVAMAGQSLLGAAALGGFIGATTAAASGVATDNFSLRAVLKSALISALTAGLTKGLTQALQLSASVPVYSPHDSAQNIARTLAEHGAQESLKTFGRIMVGGGIGGVLRALASGQFADGALAGIFQTIAAEFSSWLNEGIQSGQFTTNAADRATLRYFGKVIESAIRAAANPDHLDHALAAALIDGFANEAFPAPAGPQDALSVPTDFNLFSLEPRDRPTPLLPPAPVVVPIAPNPDVWSVWDQEDWERANQRDPSAPADLSDALARWFDPASVAVTPASDQPVGLTQFRVRSFVEELTGAAVTLQTLTAASGEWLAERSIAVQSDGVTVATVQFDDIAQGARVSIRSATAADGGASRTDVTVRYDDATVICLARSTADANSAAIDDWSGYSATAVRDPRLIADDATDAEILAARLAALSDDWDLFAANGRGVRPPRSTLESSNWSEGPSSPNRRIESIFEALADGLSGQGLVPEAYRDLTRIGRMLPEIRAQAEIERMKTSLERSGFGVPTAEALGARPGNYSDGRARFDTADLLDRYANAVRLTELAKLRVIEIDTQFRITSIGNSGQTPERFVAEIEARYARAFADGVEQARRQFSDGRLPYPRDMPEQLQIGLAADRTARDTLLGYLRSIGVPEGPGQLVALNRWAYDRQGSGLFLRPDVFVDLGPGARSWTDGKASMLDVLQVRSMLQQANDYYRFTGSSRGSLVTGSGTFPVPPPIAKTRK